MEAIRQSMFPRRFMVKKKEKSSSGGAGSSGLTKGMFLFKERKIEDVDNRGLEKSMDIQRRYLI